MHSHVFSVDDCSNLFAIHHLRYESVRGIDAQVENGLTAFFSRCNRVGHGRPLVRNGFFQDLRCIECRRSLSSGELFNGATGC